MHSAPLRVKLSWDDPATGDKREPTFGVPIALGREFSQMPSQIQGRPVSRLVLNSLEISRFHALIDHDSNGLVVVDQNSRNGTFVNGTRIGVNNRVSLANGEALQIGPYHITVSFGAIAQPAPAASNSQILFNPSTGLPDHSPQPLLGAQGVAPIPSISFPPPIFHASEVDVQDLHATGLSVDEVDYATIGAGLGSFVWVDYLRIYGVKAERIAALGIEPQPYSRYKQLCLSSQIPLHERLRSNSDSCPDNVWGFPSYAFREAWHEALKGRLGASLGYLWQVFAEPTFAQTYTPRAGNVFDALDREAVRIGWDQIFRYGSVRSIRKTTDGRYAIAFSRTTTGRRAHAFLIARFVHLATGYPAITFLPDLQAYREKTLDFKSVVNAYEPHDHVYQHLEQYGGTVMIRGRGIVASRIVQRVYEARARNPQIRLVHLMRSPKPHCTTRYPIGVKCIVCCEYLKRSEALKISKEYGGAENRVSVRFFHRSCHQQVNQIHLGRGRTSCPVCKCSIEFETASSVSCRNCGQNFLTNLADPTFDFCCYCSFRLNTSLEVAIKDAERQFLDGWITQTTYAHKICYTRERQAGEQELLRKEQLLKLKFKKERAKVLRQDKAEQIIKTIGAAILSSLIIGTILGGMGGVMINWIFKLGFNWQSTALFGFLVVFILTIVTVLLFSLPKFRNS